MTDDKMDTADIAEFLRRSRAYVTDTITKFCALSWRDYGINGATQWENQTWII